MKRLLAALFALALAACAAPNAQMSEAPGKPAMTGGKTEVLWLGQSAMRITTPTGKVIMIDPWLTSNPKTPPGYKNLAALGKIDVILVTHAHFDHITDGPALAKLNDAPMYSPAYATMIATGQLPPRLSPGMNKSGTVHPLGPDISITMVHAEHDSEYIWHDPATGHAVALPGGEPVGYIIRLENGFTIWHMGDTGLFGDMKFIAQYYKPDLVLIPTGGNFTMDPKDAAFAVREWIKPKYAIPMHYGTFPAINTNPQDFADALKGTSTKVIIMKPGEKVDF